MLPLSRSSRHAIALLALSLAVAVPAVFTAPPAVAQATVTTQSISGVDVYGGWGYLNSLNSNVAGYKYPVIDNFNATVSGAYFFNHHLGAQVEGEYFSGGNKHSVYPCVAIGCNPSVYSGEAGPIFRQPLGVFAPFGHVLFGGVRMNGPGVQPLHWGYGLTAGGGVDLILPYFNHSLALRLLQADFQYDHVNFGATNPGVTPAGITGGTSNRDAVKLSEGLVFRFGQQLESKIPLVFGCAAGPTSVYAGETVTVTGSTVGLPKKTPRPITYTWAAKAGTVTSSGETATIDTTGLAPGQYDVVGKLSFGPGISQQGFCSAPFTVLPFDPPTITCSATPSSVITGTSSQIDCIGRSPQHRPLTYACSTSAGTISGVGQSETLATVGVPPGTVSVTCKVTDDTAQTASTVVQVAVTKPRELPPPPKPEQLCTLNFVRDARRPARVDNEAKGCLDDIALSLNLRSDAKLILVGNGTDKEKSELAAERTINARTYLINEKGIDGSRIEIRLGDTSGKSVKSFLVPAGATFTGPNTQTFDEHSVTPHGQAYPGQKVPGAKPKRRKPAVKKTPAPPTP
jgi:hypothetical protein